MGVLRAIPGESVGGRRPAADHRRVLDGILWIARTGAPWRDLPDEFGNWNSVWRQFRRWTTAGVWDLLLQALADGGGDADTLQMIDSTIIRAHHCAAGARGDSRGGSWLLARRLLDQNPPARQRARAAHRPRSEARPSTRRDRLCRPDGAASILTSLSTGGHLGATGRGSGLKRVGPNATIVTQLR